MGLAGTRWMRGLRTRWRNLRLAARDASYGRGFARPDRRILVLRQKTHLADYNDDFLAWVKRTSPRDAGSFLLRRLPSRRAIDWNNVTIVLPWVQDPLREHHPRAYEALKDVEAQADARGIPVLNRADALSNSIKSVASGILTRAGIRTPKMMRITDAGAFRASGAVEMGFPLVIREDRGHGARIVLVRDAAELASVRLEAYECPLAVEFLDTRGPGGLFRKYRYVAIGDGGASRHMIASRQWEVRVRSRVMTPAIAAEEVAYLAGEIRERDTFRAAREALGLDVVSFDYGFDADGQLIVWDANPAAILWDPNANHAGLEHQRPYVERLYSELLRYYMARAARDTSAPAEPSSALVG